MKSLFRGDSASPPRDFLKSLAVLTAASLIGLLFYYTGLSEANIITIYIFGVLITSVWTTGRFYSILSALLSVILFNFLFTVPRFTLWAYDADYPVTFFIMLLVGVLTGSLAKQIKKQAKLSDLKSYWTSTLLETSRKLQKASGEKEILSTTVEQLYKLLERPIIFYTKEEPRKNRPSDERAYAAWVFKNNHQAGAGTDTFSSAKNLYLAVRGNSGVQAVACITMENHPLPSDFEKNLLIAILDECGLALDKEKISQQKQQAEMAARQEALRANLLRSISHDLRTPLTSINGNAGILMKNEDKLSREKRRLLYSSICDDSIWLIDLVENLLSVTRMENGSMVLHMEPELIDEVFREALRHVDIHASSHKITTHLDDDLLMATLDAKLMMQVIINLVNNAIQYTPPQSDIVLSAQRTENRILIKISDNGPGISDEAKAQVFDMFYTADNLRGDGRRNLGLGLTLCRSIVNAHGGALEVKDNSPRGSVFYFTLPAVEIIPGT